MERERDVVLVERLRRWRRWRRVGSGMYGLRSWWHRVQQGFGLPLELVQGEGATKADVFPPEGQEEAEVGAVHGAGHFEARVGVTTQAMTAATEAR